MNLTRLLIAFLSFNLMCALSVLAQKSDNEWWQRGELRYHFKDDWKADFLCYGAEKSPTPIPLPFEGLWNDLGRFYYYQKVLELPAKPKQAWIQLWSSGATQLLINDVSVGCNYDFGFIDHYDITKYLKKGKNKIVIRFSSREKYWEVIAEGGVFYPGGKYLSFGTDKTWGTKPRVETHKKRKLGPKGYAGKHHHSPTLLFTPEQKAKAAVNSVIGRCLRLNSFVGSGDYNFWKSRDFKELMQLSQTSPEEATRKKVIALTVEAKKETDALVPLVKAGKFAQVMIDIKKPEKLVQQAETLQKLLIGTADLRDKLKALDLQVKLIEQEKGFIKNRQPEWQKLKEKIAKQLAANNQFLSELRKKKAFAIADAAKITEANKKIANTAKALEKFIGLPLDSLNKSTRNRLGWVSTERLQNSCPDSHEYRISPCNAKLSSKQKRFIGMGSLRELHYQDGAEMLFLNSALSPASLVVSSTKTIQFSDWTKKKYKMPDMVSYLANGELKTVTASDSGTQPLLNPQTKLSENWLLVWDAAKTDKSPRPLLILLEDHPSQITLKIKDDRITNLKLDFEQTGCKLLVMRLNFPRAIGHKLSKNQISKIRDWSAKLRKYPISFAEICRFKNNICEVRMKYDYLDFGTSWKQPPAPPHAPVPQLFSYARQYQWPAAKFAENSKAIPTGYRGYPKTNANETGEYFLVENIDTLVYEFDRKEPKRMLYGLGEFTKGLNPPEQLYKDVEKWNMNSTRPQFHFNRNFEWGWKNSKIGFFFTHPDPKTCKHDALSPGGKILFHQEAKDALRAYIKNFQDRNMTCILNWFWNDKPMQDPKTWKKHPEVRKMIVKFWGQVAKTLEDFPEETVIYDLFNEPYAAPHEPYNKLVTDLIREIRKYDKKHVICVEPGNGWADAWQMDGLKIPKDPKLMIEWHAYGPHGAHIKTGYNLFYPRYTKDDRNASSYDEWEERMVMGPIRASIRLDAEVMHGEFGVSFVGPPDGPEAWLRDILTLSKKYRQHWNWWNWDGKRYIRTGLKSGNRENPLVKILSKFAKDK